MARKSNKTAHVLNLIAGHEAPAESTEETLSSGDSQTSTVKKAAPAANTPSQTISVIDTTEEDPVADLIQQNLTNKFEEKEDESASEAAAHIKPIQTQTVNETAVQTTDHTDKTAASAQTQPAQTQSAEESAPVQVQSAPAEIIESPVQTTTAEITSEPIETTPVEITQASAQNTAETPVSEEPTEPEPESSIQPAQAENAPKPEPEPEPDFVRVNVIEEVVKDKIIYFMRQFDVCTCERCIQDTIALTLNGILPKYIVTTPAAVAPLMSFYTNRYITDVTVEATKACMIVKENPRH